MLLSFPFQFARFFRSWPANITSSGWILLTYPPTLREPPELGPVFDFKGELLNYPSLEVFATTLH